MAYKTAQGSQDKYTGTLGNVTQIEPINPICILSPKVDKLRKVIVTITHI